MIRITYPYEGLYEQGSPRFEIVDKNGIITSARTATAEEALLYEQIAAMQTVQETVLQLIEEIRSVQTYGLRLEQKR